MTGMIEAELKKNIEYAEKGQLLKIIYKARENPENYHEMVFLSDALLAVKKAREEKPRMMPINWRSNKEVIDLVKSEKDATARKIFEEIENLPHSKIKKALDHNPNEELYYLWECQLKKLKSRFLVGQAKKK